MGIGVERCSQKTVNSKPDRVKDVWKVGVMISPSPMLAGS